LKNPSGQPIIGDDDSKDDVGKEGWRRPLLKRGRPHFRSEIYMKWREEGGSDQAANKTKVTYTADLRRRRRWLTGKGMEGS